MTYVLLLSIFPVCLTGVIAQFSAYSISQAVGIPTTVLMSHFTPLAFSIIVYRVFFHRLRRFPGPPLGKLGNLWHSSQIVHDNNYVKLHQWHTQYGEFVRIRPDELSVTHPDALHAVLGPKSKCIKDCQRIITRCTKAA